VFVENIFDREVVENILEEIFQYWEREILKQELEKILRKFTKNKKRKFSIKNQSDKALYWETDILFVLEKLDFKEKQKIIQKLVWKWFWYSDIMELINRG